MTRRSWLAMPAQNKYVRADEMRVLMASGEYALTGMDDVSET